MSFTYVVEDATLDEFYDVSWSGAKDRLDSIRKHCMDTNDFSAWDYLNDYISETTDESMPPTETEINDLIWFDSDDILQEAGFLDENYDWIERED